LKAEVNYADLLLAREKLGLYCHGAGIFPLFESINLLELLLKVEVTPIFFVKFLGLYCPGAGN